MFDAALKYLKNYRERRAKGLGNEEKLRWFATEAGDISELITNTFGTDSENSAWEQFNATADVDYSKLQAVRIKIAFLAGIRHDLRSQFAIGMQNDPKGDVDFTRHAISELAGARYQTLALEQVIKTKEQGVKTI